VATLLSERRLGVVRPLYIAEINLDVDLLRSPDRGRCVSKARTAIGYVLVRRLGFKVRDVAIFMCRDPTTLSVLIARLADRLEADQKNPESGGRA
jgi:hypothetical protein